MRLPSISMNFPTGGTSLCAFAAIHSVASTRQAIPRTASSNNRASSHDRIDISIVHPDQNQFELTRIRLRCNLASNGCGVHRPDGIADGDAPRYLRRPVLPEPSMPEIVTAAMLVIGDEILSGRTKDKNIGHLADIMTAIGIDLKEVRIVPDEEDEIVAAVNAVRARYTYVFTTGG